jgi:purine-binding chemotaxis protein CheW
MLEQITPVPNAPPCVEGVVFFRGQVIPAINLRLRFGFPRIPYDARTRLIVVHQAGRLAGLVVDRAREFVRIPPEAVQPPPEAVAGLSGAYVDGIARLGERLVLLLNVEALLQPAQGAPAPAGS